MNPLHKAAWEGRTTTVEHLLSNCGDRNAIDSVSQQDQ